MNTKNSNAKVVVCGGGGFIGGHLVGQLLRDGVNVIRSVDVKPLDDWYQVHDKVENVSADLKDLAACHAAVDGADLVYNLAADMGGMGFIENNKALCMLSVLINTHLLMAAKEANITRFFFSSSACVYNGDLQTNPDVTALKESDAYPALAEDGYGWEKLFSERMCRHFEEITGCSAGSRVIITSMAPMAPGPAAARRRRPRSAARSSKRFSQGRMKLKSGDLANRPAASCTSTTA